MSEDFSADDAIKSTSGELQFCVVLQASTDAANPSSGELQFCAVPHCMYSLANHQQWMHQTCGKHKDQQHQSCGCKPTILLVPLPMDDDSKEQFLKTLNLHISNLYDDTEIKLCSEHFESCNESERRPSIQSNQDANKVANNSPLSQNSAGASSLGINKSVSGDDISRDGQNASEEAAIAVLSSGLKRSVENDDEEASHLVKKLCGEKKEDAAQGQRIDMSSPTSEASSVKSLSTKTSPSQLGKPKYRASSPTIMTTRRKSQKDLTKDFNNPRESDVEAALSDQREGEGLRKRNGTRGGSTCVVPGCRVTGYNTPSGIKWYRIPKDERLRKIYLTQIGRPDFVPKKHHRICSMHFVGGRKSFDCIIPTVGVSSAISTAGDSTPSAIQLQEQSSSGNMTFLNNNASYPGWSITGNSTGSMCCIPGCKSTRRRNLALKYYRFPKEEHVHHQWLASIGLKNFMPRENSRVCSVHFEGGARSDKNSIPTIFSADTIALRGSDTGGHQVQEGDIKKEPDTLMEAAELAFHRQTSPRKQAAPQKLTKLSKTYGNYCCIPGCSSRYINSPNLSFYRIPNNKKLALRRQWLEAIGVKDVISKEARVCSLHFKGGRKGEGSRVPTIFPDGVRPILTETVIKESPSKIKSECPDQTVVNTQSSIETLLHASDILSQREAKNSESITPVSTPSSANASPIKMDLGDLPPEVPKGSSCMVPGCRNTRSNARGTVRWYRVPKDEKRRKLWLTAIGWPNAVPSDTTRICSAHFVQGIYRKKGDKAVPTIFPPKPKDWHIRYPHNSAVVKQEICLESNKEESAVSSGNSLTSVRHPQSSGLLPGSNSLGGEQYTALPFVSINRIQTHPYGPTMLSPEMFGHKQQESRGVTCCVSKCHNNTKRTQGLRWYRIPVMDPVIREQWLRFIRATRPGFKPKNHHRVCSAHFEGGMKISKTSVPTLYNKPYNRRFLPPNCQQMPGVHTSGDHHQQNMYCHQQQHQQQQCFVQTDGDVYQQRQIGNDATGPGGDAPYTKPYRVQNLQTPITQRSIPPLAYREKTEPVYVKQQVEVDRLHDFSVQVSGDSRMVNMKTTDDCGPLSGCMELKKNIGGGGRCYVPRCTNTRRHKPGLKWYRIPKDPDLRILWLHNIGRRDAEPRPHNRICSEHFEGGYKQCNTSLPTIEKWSDTSKYVYTGSVVNDPTASQVGSALLATDSHPVSVVDASFPTTTASQMQSLANSLTALAADYVVASRTSGETFSEGKETSNDMSHSTNDSILFNSDQFDDSLERSPSSCSSRSSSVESYNCSPQHNLDQLHGDPESPLEAVGSLEVGSTSTPIHVFSSSVKHVVRYQCSPSYQDPPENSVLQDHPASDLEVKGHSDVCEKVETGDSEGKNNNKGAVNVDGLNDQDDKNVQKKVTEESMADSSSETKDDLKERIRHLEGLTKTMCEDLRLKEEKLQEQHVNLTACQKRLKNKEAELERVKKKCLLMSIRLNSFRKLAQTDL